MFGPGLQLATFTAMDYEHKAKVVADCLLSYKRDESGWKVCRKSVNVPSFYRFYAPGQQRCDAGVSRVIVRLRQVTIAGQSCSYCALLVI